MIEMDISLERLFRKSTEYCSLATMRMRHLFSSPEALNEDLMGQAHFLEHMVMTMLCLKIVLNHVLFLSGSATQ